MRYPSIYILTLFLILVNMSLFAQKKTSLHYFRWSELPTLPDTYGFAGAFAGVSHQYLLFAGGANFPDGGAPWTGSEKVWHRNIFVLENIDTQWKKVGELSEALAYGVSVSYKDALICVGGSNKQGHSDKVFSITYKNGSIKQESLPSLPKPLANACGTVVGDILYVYGGSTAIDAVKASESFYAMNLAIPLNERKWLTLASLPGPERILAVAGGQGNAFYVFSGVSLKKGVDGKPARSYLKDAYRYVPSEGWERLADLPTPVAAAPSPAYASGLDHLLIFGGDNGALANQTQALGDRHPGFSDAVQGYNTDANTWAVFDKVLTKKEKDVVDNPNKSIWAPVTTTAVVWQGNVVLPSGEVRPAVRTPRVILASPTSLKH